MGTSAPRRTCACCPGSGSSSGCPGGDNKVLGVGLGGLAEPPETDPASPPQQVRPLHQARRAARCAAAPQLLPGADRQVLPGAALLVRRPVGTTPLGQDPPPPHQDPSPCSTAAPSPWRGHTINLLVTHCPGVGGSPQPDTGRGVGGMAPPIQGQEPSPPGPESSGAGMSKALFRKLYLCAGGQAPGKHSAGQAPCWSRGLWGASSPQHVPRTGPGH